MSGTIIPIETKRMLTEKEAATYTSLSRSTVRKMGKEIGCVKHYGGRIMYDRKIIDAFLDEKNEATGTQ